MGIWGHIIKVSLYFQLVGVFVAFLGGFLVLGEYSAVMLGFFSLLQLPIILSALFGMKKRKSWSRNVVPATWLILIPAGMFLGNIGFMIVSGLSAILVIWYFETRRAKSYFTR